MVTKLRSLCLIAFILLLTWVSRGSAQDNSCLNKLAPCLNYLNGTQDPPDSWCAPLKSMIKSDATCLWSLASNKGTRQAEQAGINVIEAQNLLGRCGQHVNPLSCLTRAKTMVHSLFKFVDAPAFTDSPTSGIRTMIQLSGGVRVNPGLGFLYPKSSWQYSYELCAVCNNDDTSIKCDRFTLKQEIHT